jgi:hypothetical protein
LVLISVVYLNKYFFVECSEMVSTLDAQDTEAAVKEKKPRREIVSTLDAQDTVLEVHACKLLPQIPGTGRGPGEVRVDFGAEDATPPFQGNANKQVTNQPRKG